MALTGTASAAAAPPKVSDRRTPRGLSWCLVTDSPTASWSNLSTTAVATTTTNRTNTTNMTSTNPMVITTRNTTMTTQMEGQMNRFSKNWAAGERLVWHRTGVRRAGGQEEKMNTTAEAKDYDGERLRKVVKPRKLRKKRKKGEDEACHPKKTGARNEVHSSSRVSRVGQQQPRQRRAHYRFTVTAVGLPREEKERWVQKLAPDMEGVAAVMQRWDREADNDLVKWVHSKVEEAASATQSENHAQLMRYQQQHGGGGRRGRNAGHPPPPVPLQAPRSDQLAPQGLVLSDSERPPWQSQHARAYPGRWRQAAAATTAKKVGSRNWRN